MSPAPSDRWEMGSLFHAAPIPPTSSPGGAPWEDRPHALVGSGRDALRLLLERQRPDRVWVPTFLCQEVVAAVGAVAELRLYHDSPVEEAGGGDDRWAGLRSGDAVLTVAYFGVRRPRIVPDPARESGDDGIVVIEDHTHDPSGVWARDSRADFCVASLRKLWPLPDGGVLWSPAGHEVPAPPPCLPELERASGVKLSGMELKARYLRGEAVAKPLFRELLDRGESTLLGVETSGITPGSRALLEALPFAELEQARGRRFRRLTGALPEMDGYRVLAPPEDPGGGRATPFSAFFVFRDVDARDRVHRKLVDERVFASWLWPLDEPLLDGIPESDVSLSRRTFSVPVDMRYDDADVDRAAGIIEYALRREL